MFGNLVTDLTTHAGYTSRKIDPAVAWAVEGPWQPSSVTTSGTWSTEGIRDEATRRATPAPIPPPTEDDDVAPFVILNRETGQQQRWSTATSQLTGLAGSDLSGYVARFGVPIDTDPVVFNDMAAKGPDMG